MTIFDTDILIDFLQGESGASDLMLKTPRNSRYTTVVNLIELYQGASNRKTLKSIKSFVVDSFVAILPVSPSALQLAVNLVEQHALAHGLRLADALIAAIALTEQATLVSGNERHFRPIVGLLVEVPSYK
jgi:predicted nucleic acid-binding protein